MKGMKCDGCERMVFRTHIPFTALQPASVCFCLFFFFNQSPLGERVEKESNYHIALKKKKRH